MDDFFRAASKGDLSKIQAFIQQNIDVNIQYINGNTALILAATNGNLDVVKELITKNANIDQANDDGETALIRAARCGNLEIVKELIAKNANIDQANNDGDTALILAATNGDLEVVKELIAKKADINIKDNNGYTALMWAAVNGKLNVVKELIAKKVNIDKVDNDGATALMWAAKHGKLNVVKELIVNKAGINIEDNNGYTALMWAAINDHLEVVKELLNSGSDLLLISKNMNFEILVLSNLLSDVSAKELFDKLFDKLYDGNFEGLNSLAKLQLLRAFNFMENSYDKFKDFYYEEDIQKVKASLEAFKPLETLINELTDTSVLDFSTAESRHKLENSIDQLKRLLEYKAKYESEGMSVNQSKIKEFQHKCKVVAGNKYHEFIQSLGNIGLKDIFNKYFEENFESGHVDLPDSICAQIYLKLLISNREAKENLSTNEDKVTEKLPCATDIQYETYLLTSNIEELGSILKFYE